MAASTRGYSKRDKRELLIYWVAVIAAFFWVTQSEAAPWTTYRAPLGFSMEMPGASVASTTMHRSLLATPHPICLPRLPVALVTW